MKLKAAVVTPIPNARIRTMMRLNPGLFARPLAAYRTSCRSDVTWKGCYFCELG